MKNVEWFNESKKWFVELMKKYDFESEDELNEIWFWSGEEENIEFVLMNESEIYMRYEYSVRVEWKIERNIILFDECEDFLKDYFE